MTSASGSAVSLTADGPNLYAIVDTHGIVVATHLLEAAAVHDAVRRNGNIGREIYHVRPLRFADDEKLRGAATEPTAAIEPMRPELLTTIVCILGSTIWEHTLTDAERSAIEAALSAAQRPEVQKAYYDNPVMIDGHPRAIRRDHWTAAEWAIHRAAQFIEGVGADPLLTDAVILLGDAQRKVAEYVDRQIQRGVTGNPFYVGQRVHEVRNTRVVGEVVELYGPAGVIVRRDGEAQAGWYHVAVWHGE